jgi:chromosome segregation ATPase
MLNAIGSSPIYSPSTAGEQTAALKTQLAQYELKLSDCVHCVSASTREGKEKIKELSDKISTAKAHIETIETARANNQSTTYKVRTATDNTVSKDVGAVRPVTGTLGNHLDVYS